MYENIDLLEIENVSDALITSLQEMYWLECKKIPIIICTLELSQ